MRFTFKAGLSAATLVLLSACGGSSSSDGNTNPPPSSQVCSKQNLHEFWYDTLGYEYLWLDELETPSQAFSEYQDTNRMLDDVLPSRDVFSFMVPTDAWNATIEGESFGFGIDYGPVGDELLIYQVYKNSPAEAAGMKRGDIITEINDLPASSVISMLLRGDYDAFYELLGPDEIGVEVEFSWRRPTTSSTYSQPIAKDDIQINTVAHYSVKSTNAGKIAYLAFPTGFFENSAQEIDAAFVYFKSQQPDHFILDLRDNGGGFLSVAARLSLYLAGDKLADKTFLRITHNQNLAQWNQSYSVRDLIDEASGVSYSRILANSLDLNEVVVLTNDGTASASESVINGLLPYMEVTTIGQSTYGKPVGFYANDGSYDINGEETQFNTCNETLLALNFQTENARGEADYVNGFSADCYVSSDTPVADWGELKDPAQVRALAYVQDNNCSGSLAAKPFSAPVKGKIQKTIALPGMILNK